MEIIGHALNAGSALTDVVFLMQEDESDDGEAEEKERFLSFPFCIAYYTLLLSAVLILCFYSPWFAVACSINS